MEAGHDEQEPVQLRGLRLGGGRALLCRGSRQAGGGSRVREIALGVQDRHAARQLQPRLGVRRGGRRRAPRVLRDRDQGRQERRARPARRGEDQDRLRQEALRGAGPRKRLPLQRAHDLPIRGGEGLGCRSCPER